MPDKMFVLMELCTEILCNYKPCKLVVVSWNIYCDTPYALMYIYMQIYWILFKFNYCKLWLQFQGYQMPETWCLHYYKFFVLQYMLIGKNFLTWLQTLVLKI